MQISLDDKGRTTPRFLAAPVGPLRFIHLDGGSARDRSGELEDFAHVGGSEGGEGGFDVGGVRWEVDEAGVDAGVGGARVSLDRCRAFVRVDIVIVIIVVGGVIINFIVIVIVITCVLIVEMIKGIDPLEDLLLRLHDGLLQ